MPLKLARDVGIESGSSTWCATQDSRHALIPKDCLARLFRLFLSRNKVVCIQHLWMYFLSSLFSDPSIFTMNKALVALLVIALVAGVFVEDSNAVLRAGRDRIAEKLQRAMEERREAHAKRESSNCYNGGKQANYCN